MYAEVKGEEKRNLNNVIYSPPLLLTLQRCHRVLSGEILSQNIET